MVDTVRLFTGAFDLARKNKFTHQVSHDSEGEVVGEKTFCNLPHFKLDVRDSPRRMLSFQTSLPKILYRTSLFEVKPSDFEKAVSVIEDNLSEAGVVFDKNNLADFKLSRVDFCRNLEVEHKCMDYLVYLSNRYMSRRQKRDIAHETLSFRNSDRELTFYDKLREVRETETDKQVLRLVQNREGNILRVESRLKTSRVIPKAVGIASPKLSDLFDSELSKSHLLHEVDSLVVGAESQSEFNFQENSDLIQYIATRKRRGVFKEFLAVRGVQRFLTDFRGDWEMIFEFLLCHYSRRQAYSLLAELRKYRELLVESVERDLLGEIRRKLAA